MRNLVALLSVILLIAGFGFGMVPSLPGELVSGPEANHCMGAASCYQVSQLRTTVCYGQTCQSGGCGCVQIFRLVLGGFSLADPTPCNDDMVCTAPQTVTNTSCGQ
jgi:hypothetical protein